MGVQRLVPSPYVDGTSASPRQGRYGEASTLPLVVSKHNLAEEGTYFIGTNPTPGTALAYNVQATFVDTTPFLVLRNTDSAGSSSAKRIFLDYIKVIATTAAASGTQAFYAIKTDTGARALTTDNTTAITPVSPNSDTSAATISTLRSQTSATASVIAGASANARVVARGSFGGLTIVGDELVVLFGSHEAAATAGLTAAQAAMPAHKVSVSPPVIIGPGHNATMHLWFPGNAVTGLSYELEMGWWER